MSYHRNRPADRARHCDALRPAAGKRLARLLHVQSYFEGEPDLDDLGDVELGFADGSAVTLFILNDAESVGAFGGEALVPEPLDLDDAGGHAWVKEDLAPKLDATGFIGARLERIEAMVDEHRPSGHKVLSGWRLDFDNGRFLVFFNAGDDGKLAVVEVPPTYGGVVTTFEPL